MQKPAHIYLSVSPTLPSKKDMASTFLHDSLHFLNQDASGDINREFQGLDPPPPKKKSCDVLIKQ